MFYFARVIFVVSLVLSVAGYGQTYERRTPVVEAIAKAGPAVVNIRTEQIVKRGSTPFFGFSDPFFEQFFRDLSPPRVYKTQALGSGVIVDPRGYILTNAHVIEKASKIYVALPDSRKELEAELVGRAERIDLAVLKIADNKTYPYLEPGHADDLLIGETVIAIGNPLGLGHSVTTGVVSAPRRRVPIEDDMFSIFIQMDALINPGNSGGPLININGELIGINTAIAKQAQGIGFAIPIDVVKRILPDLITYGQVRKPYLGVVPGTVGKEFSRDLGQGGVLVSHVAEGSPAVASDIRFGDVILTLESLPITTPADFFSMLQTYTPGNSVQLEILRGFTTLKKQVLLIPLPENYGLKYGEEVFGFSVVDQQDGLVVRLVRPESKAAKVGLQAGDYVAEVAGVRVENTKEFAKVIEKVLGREPLSFLIVRGNRGYHVKLP